MREYASHPGSRREDPVGSARWLEKRLAGQPRTVIDNVNRRRREQGLDPIRVLPATEYSRRLWTPTPTPPVSTRLVRSASAGEVCRLWIVAHPGMAKVVHRFDNGIATRRPLPEKISADAWDLDALNNPRRSVWDLRSGHDGKPIVSNLSGRLRCESVPGVGLVIEARLDLTKIAHRALAAQLRLCEPGVSIEFFRRTVDQRRDARGNPYELVTAADLRHVALLMDPGDRPAYAAAGVWMFNGPGHERERQRQRDAAIERALSRR